MKYYLGAAISLEIGERERVWGDSEDEDKIAFEYPFGSTGSEANLIKREFSLCKS